MKRKVSVPIANLLFLLLCLSSPGLAQVMVTVSDTVNTLSGGHLNGSITVTNLKPFTTSDGYIVAAGTGGQAIAIVRVTNGQFSVALRPNAGSTPNSSYNITYKDNGQVTLWTETWVVPSSPSVVRRSDVLVATPPPPSTSWPITQIVAPSGCSTLTPYVTFDTAWNCAGAESPNNKGQPNGYAPLDANAHVPVANLPIGTTSGTVAAGNDSRITGAEQTANKNAASGYAGLNAAGTLASAQAPTSGAVVYVGDYAGATADVRLQACANAAAAILGTCDARSLTGAQSLAATVTVPSYANLWLGSANFTATILPAFTLQSYAALIGQPGNGNNTSAGTVISIPGSSGAAVQVGTSSSNALNANVRFLTITHSSTRAADGSIGVDLTYAANAYISNFTARFVDTGAKFGGTAFCSCYNAVHALEVDSSNTYGLHFASNANQNYIYNPKVMGPSSAPYLTSAYQFDATGNNQIFAPDAEAIGTSYVADFQSGAAFNMLWGGYYEQFGTLAHFESGSYQNKFWGGLAVSGTATPTDDNWWPANGNDVYVGQNAWNGGNSYAYFPQWWEPKFLRVANTPAVLMGNSNGSGDPSAMTMYQVLREATYSAESMGTGNGSAQTFSHSANSHSSVKPLSITITAGGVTGTDDGAGNITGTGISSGSINYQTGLATVTFATAPASGVAVRETYTCVGAYRHGNVVTLSIVNGVAPLVNDQATIVGVVADGATTFSGAFTVCGPATSGCLQPSIYQFSYPQTASDDTGHDGYVNWYSYLKMKRIVLATSSASQLRLGANPSNASSVDFLMPLIAGGAGYQYPFAAMGNNNGGSFTATSINSPTPTVVPNCTVGTPCTNTWSYKLVVNDGYNDSAASSAGSTTYGSGNLTTTGDSNVLYLPSFPSGTQSIKVYRTAAGGNCNGVACTNGLIGTVTNLKDPLNVSFADTGLVGDGTTAATTNNTGGVYSNKHVAGTAATSPTWTSGTGAKSGTCGSTTAYPNGSLFSRTDGAAGSTLYVCEGGTWAAK